MDKNKTFTEIQNILMNFYGEMKWIISSKRGKKFQFMMLNRTFEAIMYNYSQIREKHQGKEKEEIKSSLDT